jgi:hypothetical protein
MAGTAAIALSAFAFRPALAIPATSSTNFTVSSAEVDTIIDTAVTLHVNTFSTELTAQMQGGPVLYDQTFPVAFADPIFQTAIGTAESVLTGAGAASFLGPTLLSSTDTLSSTTNTVQTGFMVTDISTTTTLYIGASGGTTINVGDFGVCQSYPPPTGCTIGGTPFFIPAGGVDLDTFTLTRVDIFTTTTTTNTDLLTQVYNLVGVPAAAPVPEPPTWTLLGAGLLGLGTFLFRRRIALAILLERRSELPSYRSSQMTRTSQWA